MGGPAAVPARRQELPQRDLRRSHLVYRVYFSARVSGPETNKALLRQDVVLPAPRPRVALHALEADHRAAVEGLSCQRCGRSINFGTCERGLLGGRDHTMREEDAHETEGGKVEQKALRVLRVPEPSGEGRGLQTTQLPGRPQGLPQVHE